MRPWNFSAGPAALPVPVLEQAREELLDWRGLGLSVAEISHRSAEFLELYHETIALLRALLELNDDYAVLLLQGGARGLFAALPMNLAADPEAEADYLLSGHWSRSAYSQAQAYLRASVALDCGAGTSIPEQTTWQLNTGALYTHYCPNETIDGLRFDRPPQVQNALVADMSSMLLTEAITVRDYGIIYACAQKNLGIAGLSLVLVRRDLLGRQRATTPDIWHFAKQGQRDSMINTPPTLALYFLNLVLQWVQTSGGVPHFERLSLAKSQLIYECIDSSSGFYRNPIQPAFRSRVNIPFSTGDAELDKRFVAEADAAGLRYLKGHRAIGGMRASMYNAMELAGAERLANFMTDFSKKYR